MLYFDTHAHYDWKEFDDDRNELFNEFEERINQVLAEKYFSDIVPVHRTFSCVAVAYTEEQYPDQARNSSGYRRPRRRCPSTCKRG